MTLLTWPGACLLVMGGRLEARSEQREAGLDAALRPAGSAPAPGYRSPVGPLDFKYPSPSDRDMAQDRTPLELDIQSPFNFAWRRTPISQNKLDSKERADLSLVLVMATWTNVKSRNTINRGRKLRGLQA